MAKKVITIVDAVQRGGNTFQFTTPNKATYTLNVPDELIETIQTWATEAEIHGGTAVITVSGNHTVTDFDPA